MPLAVDRNLRFLQIFRGDLMKFCEGFMKITFKLT